MSGDLPSLDLAVVTHRPEGLERVARMVVLPPVEGLRYVVSWQDHLDAPVPLELAGREDIEIHRFEGKGISANRNNAIEHCRGDIILFADDDIIYNKDGLTRLREVYRDNTALDVATFRSEHGDLSRFPNEEKVLTEKYPPGYIVSSIEISFRRSTAGDLRCCPELGIGSEEFPAGEDEVFLLTAIRRGLNCRFFPITICAHPHESTGTKGSLSRATLMASGCVIALQYPGSAALRIPLKAWRLWRSGKAPLLKALGALSRGAMQAHGLRKRNRKYLW